ncbi:MAG: D-glucuronyl C5-epimerase family protein [Desulfobulbus sp.]|jgi:hypothetical protein|nr:D-glucuronyl C5-epimerase family protein [Desulfobulbus sp.]
MFTKIILFFLNFTFLILFPNISFSKCDVFKPFEYGVNSSAAEYARKGRNSLDENGILVFDYGKAYGGLGKWHNPFFIARYAHALYRDWYNSSCSDTSLEKAFLDQAQFFLDSKKDVPPNMAYWIYPFENTYYGVGPGWISGIGQSQIAGVLLRAYAITKESKFKTAALKAIEVYFHDVSSGGVVTDSNKGLWIQEVPCPDGRTFNILNGHITGLLGVRDLAILLEDERLHGIFKRGLEAVRNHLPEFDAGFSSFYSLEVKKGSYPKIAPLRGYNKLHAWQLERLYEITGEKIFKQYSLLFLEYDNIRYRKRTAKGSIDPAGHGPDKAAGAFGVTYWSHGDFPTWYEIDLDKNELLDAFFIGGYTQNTFPVDFALSVFSDGKWSEIYRTSENKQKDILLSFSVPISVARIRVEINSTNSKTVALNALMPIRSREQGSTLTLFPPKVSQSILAPGFRLNSR